MARYSWESARSHVIRKQKIRILLFSPRSEVARHALPQRIPSAKWPILQPAAYSASNLPTAYGWICVSNNKEKRVPLLGGLAITCRTKTDSPGRQAVAHGDQAHSSV